MHSETSAAAPRLSTLYTMDRPGKTFRSTAAAAPVYTQHVDGSADEPLKARVLYTEPADLVKNPFSRRARPGGFNGFPRVRDNTRGRLVHFGRIKRAYAEGVMGIESMKDAFGEWCDFYSRRVAGLNARGGSWRVIVIRIT